MDHYCVFGNPVEHSKSPLIHRLFAEQTGQSLVYEARKAPLEGFAAAVHDFFRGGSGANVTVPFKEEAYRLADVLTGRARRAGAVNTLKKQDDGRLLGDNTDGAGLVRDLQVNAGFALTGKRILIVGAGGAVRGILEPMLAMAPEQIVLINRTPDKARRLAEAFADLGPVSWQAVSHRQPPFDLIVNGTSASLNGDLPAVQMTAVKADHTLCYDMMYGAQPTVFCRWAGDLGGVPRDGLGMLVEQAAEAFFVWRGIRPQTVSVLDALRSALA